MAIDPKRRRNARHGNNRPDPIKSTADDISQQAEANAIIKSNPTSNKTRNAEEEIVRTKAKKQLRILSYPSDIETEIQPHSVQFGIKVREQSKIGSALVKKAAGDPAIFEPSNNNRINAEQGDAFRGVAVTAATLGAAGVARAAASSVSSSNLIRDIATVVGGAAGVAAGSYALFGNKNRTVSTNTFINLYIPQAPQAKYSAQWQEADLGALTGALATGDGEGSLADLLKSGGELVGRSLIGAADIGRALGLNVNFGGAVQAITKRIENPFKEQLFKTMNFRDFAFEYKFAPRNQKELNSVMDIIELFKMHMHSEKSQDGLFLIYPSEFSIEFRYKGQRNDYVNRIADCALTDMRVDYGQGGTFTTFKDTRGAPSEITMQLAFKELEILTRDMVEQGY